MPLPGEEDETEEESVDEAEALGLKVVPTGQDEEPVTEEDVSEVALPEDLDDGEEAEPDLLDDVESTEGDEEPEK